MHSNQAIPSSVEDRARRIEDDGRKSAQEAGLLRWLQRKAATGPTVSDVKPRADRENGKVTTLRKALAAEGLDIVPDPLHRYPCPKVARVARIPRSRG